MWKRKKITKKAYKTQTFNNKKFTCSKKCSLLKTKETCLHKFGVDNPFKSEKIKEKISKTNLKRFGVKNPQQSSKIKQKTENTNTEKYGYRRPSMSESIKEKVKNSNQVKFGVDYPAQSNNIKNKMMNSCYEKYGVYNFSKTKKFKGKVKKYFFEKMFKKLKKYGILLEYNDGKYKIKCKLCNNIFYILYNLMYKRIQGGEILCTNCNSKRKPLKEIELYNFINENYEGEIIRNSRKLISNEIDIYLPDLKLGFEFNGLYWHSSLYKSKKYHLNKTEECENIGINLIHVWEDDWKYNNLIVKSIILNRLKKNKSIYARKTIVKELDDNKIIKIFLNTNHLHGFIRSSIKIGLFHKGKLVTIITFSKLKKNSYELLRFSNCLNFNVVGGFSKLLKFFIKKYNPHEIITYSDNSIHSGGVYEKLGFKLLYKTRPNYYWIIDGIKENRFNYKKDKLVKKDYNKNKTEVEIMEGLGYYRIFDSGSKKWRLKFK